MNSNANEPAFPRLAENCQRVNETEMSGGLTKREYFAAMAMQGMIAGISKRDEYGIIANSPSDIAEIAMTYADCLLSELAKGAGDANAKK